MAELSLLERFEWMARLRAFDTTCLQGVPTREIHGELHTSIGQEAIAGGMAGWLRQNDAIVASHRNHYHGLIKGTPARALLAEIFERSTGLCGGFGGHMHPFDPENNFSATGIVGAALPVALGYAYAAQYAGRDSVAVAVIGDGATNHGTFHECLNIAAAWGLPLIVVVENNGIGISVDIEDVTATATIAERAAAYECVGETVDGTDVEAVSVTFQRMVAEARESPAPFVLEATCYRFQGHFEGDAQIYRDKDQHARMLLDHDPLLVARNRLLTTGAATADELDAIESRQLAEFEALLADVRADPAPDPASVLDHVFVDSVEAKELS